MSVAEALATENPLAEGLEPPPMHATGLLIFGATGDLARRKLLPAIYNLAHDGLLPTRFGLVGIARGRMDDEEFRGLAAEAVHRFSRRPPERGRARAATRGRALRVGSVRRRDRLYVATHDSRGT
ncbi:MAG TPA: hypothetical protein VHZ27_14185 [Solirubrobacteraceae bacterium]|nr:hypothetical protein [Solirubrobacteraceae bacterium]